jgi:hypothetical protein
VVSGRSGLAIYRGGKNPTGPSQHDLFFLVSTSVWTRAFALFSSYLLPFFLFFVSTTVLTFFLGKNHTKIWRANPPLVSDQGRTGHSSCIAMRHWSQGPLQPLIQKVKKRGLLEEFWGPFEFFGMVAEAF